jgi:hypothetical protein
VALMDQTTLAASLYVIGDSLGASEQNSWITAAYFVYVYCFRCVVLKKTHESPEHLLHYNLSTVVSLIYGLGKSYY